MFGATFTTGAELPREPRIANDESVDRNSTSFRRSLQVAIDSMRMTLPESVVRLAWKC